MNNRKYHTDPEELLRQGKEIMSSSDDSKFYFRVFSVNMVLSGLPVSQISKFAGVSRMTVSSWVKIADEKGFDALKLKGHKGRPPKLTGGQLKEIRQTLESEPQKYGYHVWDGPSLSDYISSKYNITLSVRQCQRLFHSLGFSLIRPQLYPSKGYEDTDARIAFKKINEVKADSTAILTFQDEVHFQIQTTITRGWFEKGSAPKVKSFPARFKSPYSGFVIPETGELFTAKPEKFNYETTIASIREFLAAKPLPKGKHYVLVMDNAPWHKKAYQLIAVDKRPEYADISDKITILMLPPYSPDLNPIEQVWRKTRREYTHNRFFATLMELMETVEKAFEAWKKPNNQLRTLCSFK